MKTSKEGIDLIRHFEGFSPKAYKDVAGVWTIGYGFIDGVKEGDTITLLEAEERLERELVAYEQAVDSLITWPMTQNQFDALVSFTYNLGEGNLRKSTLRKKVNAGKHVEASLEFDKWVHAGGKKHNGLVRRRKAEADMFMGLPWLR